jgi:hypothetical protein
VTVVDPAETPVTTPDCDTVATDGFRVDQVGARPEQFCWLMEAV